MAIFSAGRDKKRLVTQIVNSKFRYRHISRSEKACAHLLTSSLYISWAFTSRLPEVTFTGIFMGR